MKNLKKNQGITLIALVITIIVMLILVAVTINMALNGGLFEYAGKAAKDTNTAIRKEQNLADLASGLDYEDLIDKYTTEDYDEDGWDMAWTCTDGTWSDGVNEAGDVIAKAYKRGTVTIEETPQEAYHLVIEKGNGTGQMGVLVAALNTKNTKVAQQSPWIIDSNKGGLVIAKTKPQPVIPSKNFAWRADLSKSLITKVKICDGVKNIGYKAFLDCSNLVSIEIPNSVTTIEDRAFRGCTNLQTVTIPNSVTTIGNGAFDGCTNLQTVTIPNSVITIGNGAFQWCTNLQTVTIPNSVTTIGDTAFQWCTNLQTVTIPNSVTTIGACAFYGCTNLQTVTTIGVNAFYNVPQITYSGSATGAPWGALSMR